VHYLLANGSYAGDAPIGKAERKALLETARLWFSRAYIYGGSESSQRFAEFCEEKGARIRPDLYAAAS